MQILIHVVSFLFIIFIPLSFYNYIFFSQIKIDYFILYRFLIRITY